MKRRIYLVIALCALALSIAACGNAAEQTVEFERVVAETASGGVAPAAAPQADMAAVEESMAFDSSAANQVPTQQRLIIRSADMSIVATDTEEALATIAAMADNGGGWVVSSNVYQSSETTKTGYIEIRIPAEGFQSVLDAISGLAVEVTELNTSGQDVTEEFVDLSARLRNLEATAARLRTFLDESENVEEALAVNIELSRVESDIEAFKGRIQFLEQSAAFSSITVRVTPDELAQPIQVAGWQPTGVAKEAIQALVNMLQVIANAAIWLVLFALPVVLVLAIPLLLIIWLWRRWRRRGETVEVVDTTAGE